MSLFRPAGPAKPTLDRVNRIVETRITTGQPQRDVLILMEVEARLQTITPMLRAGMIAEARETAEQSAAAMVLVAMMIGGQAIAVERAR